MIQWRKSTVSNNGECVQLADLGDRIGMRDSKLGDGSPVLSLSRGQLADLIEGVKAGEFDDLT